MTQLSTRPYLLRALYEWCGDSGYTPHLAVWVDDNVRVPPQYVKDNQIVLNIAASATQNLRIERDWVSFSARFGGVAQEVWIPIGNVLSLFARETGEGMGFELEPMTAPAAEADLGARGRLKAVDPSGDDDDKEPPSGPRNGGRPQLKIVK